MKIYSLLLILLLFAIFSNSCDILEPHQKIEKIEGIGVFVVNEGNFQFSNSSLTHYDPKTKDLQQKVFQRTNDIPLGDVAQSMVIRDSIGYVVLNNSGRVYAFNVNTYEYAGWINGLTSPRYIHFVSDEKGYITDLYAKSIAVFNPKTMEITGHISVDNGSEKYNQHATEQMVQYGEKVFVNCWSFNNKILVIDAQTDRWIDSIEVGVQPVGMQLTYNNKLWVLTDGGYMGNPYGHEAPMLMRINVFNYDIEKTFTFNLDDSPSELHVNSSRDTLYFLNNGVWRISADAEVMPEEPFIKSDGRLFYALGIHPYWDDIYVSDAIDYLQPGVVYRYSAKAEPIDTFQTGIVPGSFCFE